jgi:hypothetical protein
MSTHTDKPNGPPNGTGYVALKEWVTLWLERLEIFYNRRFEDLDAKTTLALSGADKAVSKAEAATEKRFDAVNEFRQTLADQAASLMPRAESISKFDNLEKDLNDLKSRIDRGEGTLGGRERQKGETQGRTNSAIYLAMVGIGVIFSVVMSIISLIVHMPK